MAQSKFPIPPEKLVKRAKEVLAAEFGTKEGSAGNFLAEDFQFVTWEKMGQVKADLKMFSYEYAVI